ncbi:hypothetical protein NEOKW01_0355 [Nematocida sp. AWRm80]|nr:hypothetical protein NEOKW01_0355 [Nematocida sp. AWRm80]
MIITFSTKLIIIVFYLIKLIPAINNSNTNSNRYNSSNSRSNSNNTSNPSRYNSNNTNNSRTTSNNNRYNRTNSTNSRYISYSTERLQSIVDPNNTSELKFIQEDLIK